MTIPRSNLIYHTAGLAAAVTLFGLYPIIGNNQTKGASEIDLLHSSLNQTHEYRAFSSGDYAGLSRIAAAKAVNRDSIVKAGFQASKICNDVESVSTNPIPVQIGHFDSNPDYWTGQYLTTKKTTTFQSACKNPDKNTVIFTDSSVIREKSKSLGVSPDLFAIAAYR